MIQTAAALSQDGAFNIHDIASAATLTVNADPIDAGVKLTATSLTPDTLKGSFFESATQLQYGGKVKVSFAVKDSYRIHFTLIKGLLEFHRTSGFVFTFNRQAGTFDFTTPASAIGQPLEELGRFLKKIGTWLDQELSFKKQLKEMIAFEKEYRNRLAQVYASGEGYTLTDVR